MLFNVSEQTTRHDIDMSNAYLPTLTYFRQGSPIFISARPFATDSVILPLQALVLELFQDMGQLEERKKPKF